MKRSRFPLICTLFTLLLFYVPLFILAINSFNASRFGTSWSGFTLKWYQLLFQSEDVLSAFLNSMIVAFCSTILSTSIGVVAAYALYRLYGTKKNLYLGMIYAPLLMPDILMGISLLLWFVWLTVPLGLLSIILSHTTFSISYVAIIVYAKLKTIDQTLFEAAQDLGASVQETFFKVLLPLLTPSVIAGGLIAFTLSLDDFIITTFVAGPGSTTLPLYVYSMIKYGSTPLINALSTLLIGATFCLIFLIQKLSKESLT